MSEDGEARLDVFYPIVPDADWLARLVPLGLRTIQLRVKNQTSEDIRRQITASLDVARRCNCQLIVNDYWREAIESGADYVHLGQEDLRTADLAAIKAAGMHLGISTHSETELETALATAPDYVALGPIYETKLKVMKWAPQGVERIAAWKTRIGDVALVAIGGLTPERATQALAAGAQSVAVITDFMTAPDPEMRIRQWLEWADKSREIVGVQPQLGSKSKKG